MQIENHIEHKPAKSTGAGYFQVSLSAAQDVASRGSLDALAALVVLSWGVDNSGKLPPRTSTHGAHSIRVRTHLGRDKATVAMNELEAIGAIQLPGPDLSTTRATCRMSPERTDLVAIANSFVRTKCSPLQAILTNCHGSPASVPYYIPASQARKDSLVLFLALHQAQDIGAFGGIDPSVVRGQFLPIEDGDCFDQSRPVAPIVGAEEYSVVTMREPAHQVVSTAFADRILSPVEAPDSDASPFLRARHAMSQLRYLELAYTAHVLWDLDPIERKRSAQPLATLYVKGSSLSECEPYLQYKIDAALSRTDTVPGNVQWARSGDDRVESVFRSSGLYRYIVPTRDVATAVLLAQSRVRWYPFDSNHASGLELELQRIEAQSKVLHELGLRASV